MTLQEFTRDIVPIISMIVAGGGLVFVGFQLRYASAALKQNSSWNKVHATYSFFDLERSIELEYKAIDLMEKNEIDIEKGLSLSDAKAIYLNRNMKLALERFLNDLECYAGAYLVGALDREISYHLYSDRLVLKYERYKNYILTCRDFASSPAALIELEKLALNWKERLAEECMDIEKEKILLQQLAIDGGLKNNSSL